MVGHMQQQTEKRFKKPLAVVYYDVNFSHEYASSELILWLHLIPCTICQASL